MRFLFGLSGGREVDGEEDGVDRGWRAFEGLWDYEKNGIADDMLHRS
jgi:hypothetical protein